MILVWDASGLYHSGVAERSDVLGDLASALNGGDVDQVTTQAVRQELASKDVSVPGWISEVVHVDELEELAVLVKWHTLLSSRNHNRGESTVLAWAETHGAIAIVDDRGARRVAAAAGGVTVHGTLWVVAEAIKAGGLAEISARNFVDTLRRSGARFPFEDGEYLVWARDNGLLP